MRYTARMQTPNSYTRTAKAFHWLMAVLIIGMLAMGLYMVDLERDAFKLQLYGWHKATGMVILFLAVARAVWRYTHTPPDYPAGLEWIIRKAANLSHAALYVLMFAMPITGWIMSSAAGYPVSVFGLFTVPNLVDSDHELREMMGELHELFAWILIGVISVHAGAALWHHFVRKDETLKRML